MLCFSLFYVDQIIENSIEHLIFKMSRVMHLRIFDRLCYNLFGYTETKGRVGAKAHSSHIFTQLRGVWP